MLKFVPDHLKTKKICEHAVKKLPYLLRYVPNQYKSQQMCDKAILQSFTKYLRLTLVFLENNPLLEKV